ncbi:MAG: transcriptional regulator GcvA [Burkholderiales bacterium]|nr:transcriptional regulator GcvA [Burkholderiales bacterium]
MSRRLPPLNALRAFEAAARHRSFVHAARELHVTPAAISHQVKGLEEFLGVELFRRGRRGLALTDAARACLPRLTEGFDRIAEAVERLRSEAEAAALTVSSAPSFATKWLAPRLHRFAAAHPELDVRINASTRLVDASRSDAEASGEASSTLEDADVAIRFGSGAYPGYRVDKLMSVAVSPVCSPALLDGRTPLRAPEDLRRHTLIHDNLLTEDGRPLWEAWLELAGVEGVDLARGIRFNHSALALEAAADGLGVALGITALAAADIAAGRLARPFDLALPLASAYWLVCAERACERPDVAAFRNWILEEARAASAQREDESGRKAAA